MQENQQIQLKIGQLILYNLKTEVNSIFLIKLIDKVVIGRNETNINWVIIS